MPRRSLETVRRQRLGDLRRLFRHRYGPVLPDDDAGREDLIELLKPISLGPNPMERMRHEIELVAPWASAAEIIHFVNQLPIWERKVKSASLGQSLRVTNADRELLRLWTILPVDMTTGELAEQRKAKDRARKIRKRREQGARPRAVYEAESKRRLEPWNAENVSKATWYRRRAAGETSPSGAKLDMHRTYLSHAASASGQKASR